MKMDKKLSPGALPLDWTSLTLRPQTTVEARAPPPFSKSWIRRCVVQFHRGLYPSWTGVLNWSALHDTNCSSYNIRASFVGALNGQYGICQDVRQGRIVRQHRSPLPAVASVVYSQPMIVKQ